MPQNWKTYKLGEFANLRKENIHPKNFSNEDYIGLEHIGQGTFSLDGIGKSSDVTSNKSRFNSGDILYGKIRPYFQKVYRPNFNGICSTDILVIKSLDESIVDQSFLYQIAKTKFFTEKAVETSTGTKMPRADWNPLTNIEFSLPPLPEQRAIASILSALDDKIELNLQMNKTLEEMAMSLYKHWFVDFGPFKDGKFIDSELGIIPEGWEVKRLGEISISNNKFRKPISTREREKIQGVYPYYGATKILDYIDHFNLSGEFILLAEDGTVKTENDTPFLQFVHGKFCVSNHAHVLSGFSFYGNNFLYLALSNINVIPYITGAVQLKINKQNLDQMRFIVGPKVKMIEFENLVKPLFCKLKANESESQILIEKRDSLLPKLISGEIRVKDLEVLQNI
jgi:type I restriction enzyme S subunit